MIAKTYLIHPYETGGTVQENRADEERIVNPQIENQVEPQIEPEINGFNEETPPEPQVQPEVKPQIEPEINQFKEETPPEPQIQPEINSQKMTKEEIEEKQKNEEKNFKEQLRKELKRGNFVDSKKDMWDGKDIWREERLSEDDDENDEVEFNKDLFGEFFNDDNE